MTLEHRQVGGGDELLEQELGRHLAGGRREAVDERAQQPPARQAPQQPGRLVPQVGGIAAEELVRALTGEDDLYVRLRGFGEQVGRQQGGVADRLGEAVGHDVEGALQRCVVGGDDVMDGADVVRHLLGERALVIAGFEEAHGVGVQPLAGHGARRGGDEKRRVEAAAREDAQRNVAHQLTGDGADQHVAELPR